MITIPFYDSLLKNWILSASSCSYSNGSPENVSRFRELAKSIPLLENAKLREDSRIAPLISRIQILADQGSSFDPDLSNLVKIALSAYPS